MARYAVRIDPIWRPLLAPFGALESGSYAEVRNHGIHIHFGFLFERTFSHEEIESASRWQPAWWHGIGYRSNLAGRISLLGSHQGVVEVRLKKRSRSWGVFPLKRIAISLQDPQGFLDELGVPVQ
jgi:hypothetical protein